MEIGYYLIENDWSKVEQNQKLIIWRNYKYYHQSAYIEGDGADSDKEESLLDLVTV